MGLQCVLFGHGYGDIEVEERREQDGNEVITTVRETRTCRRCGEELVVSENKEVTTVETAGDDIDGEGGTPEQPDSGTTTSGPAGSTGRTADTETDDAEILSNDATTSDGAAGTTTPTVENTGTASSGTDRSTASADETAPAADTTGGDGTESSGLVSSAERALGEDPESDPKNKDPETDDAVILGEEEEERQPGEWPEEPEPEDDTDWEPPTDLTSDDEPDEQAEESEKFEDEPEIEQTKAVSTVLEGEFRCPECGFSVDAEESSLRAGDFCPECHRGALEHHAD